MISNSELAGRRTGYSVKVSSDPADDEWDEFVLQTPGSHYAQTSKWARVQSIRGFECTRIMLHSASGIIGGAQILCRRLPIIGSFGYITRGPVCDYSNLDLVEKVIHEITRICRQKRIIYLALTMPVDGKFATQILQKYGFQITDNSYEEIASVSIDLTLDVDVILSNMKLKKRQTIRQLGRKNALKIINGTSQDISDFYRLYTMSSQRIGFYPHSEVFFQTLWDCFGRTGNLLFLISKLENEPVSACMAIAFRETVYGYVIGWSGKHKQLFPNDALHWNMILQAKSSGFHIFDFGGIELDLNRPIMRNVPIAEQFVKSYCRIKLEYGGDVYFYPDNYEFISNSLLRWGYTTIYPKIPTKFFIDYIDRLIKRRAENL
ncbi:MAG: peptidoglycan bridge formation glycyltransferase FemA/FemB family protein [Leptolinea sp.]|jgi:lipid II:glycine glycyltransferase (peptidoglycan interpeptide bridge formation enzyme)|nr:peptidoglycan bridge formation glycyltransferase FemA/FemB family protein [Leptolinea sp.]